MTNSASAVRIQLSWEDPASGEQRNPILAVPIALGREFAQMPATFGEQRVSRIVLDSEAVSRYHTLIQVEGASLVVIDQNSSNSTLVNGTRQSRSLLTNGDTLQIGPYQISVTFAVNFPTSPPPANSTILFNPDTDAPDAELELPASAPTPTPASPAPPAIAEFPPPAFNAQQVSIDDLMMTGLPIQEFDYATIGAGLGSFVWVDLLRIGGVRAEQVVALGMEPQPYARYQRLCRNSQIPLHERLRSNSDSCPDNIWGFPSYAMRESWHDLLHGQIGAALSHLWQVFAEPSFAQTYTPRSGNVFSSLDREAKRIGWEKIYQYGRVRAIRQTTDGRYVIAYSRSSASRRDHAFVLARYIHLSPGYPAIQFLPDLQEYREKTKDFKSVVNAYEAHDHIYQHLEQHGGTVLLRGRGIVASRVVQRIYEARQRHKSIAVLHLLRSPKPQGNKFELAQRCVENHYEFQPFNWPKACWGGELRTVLEQADPQQRLRLLADWGGTTTADRTDWRRIVKNGIAEGWYQVIFGEVERVEQDAQNKTVTYIQEKGTQGTVKLEAHFIVDATGLDAKVKTNPLLDDFVTHYNLPLHDNGRLAVANNFEVAGMRNETGRFYAAGAITLGGPYAAVDSFLGLQYAALVAVDSLAAARAPKLNRLNMVNSLGQWVKWVLNQAP